MFDDYLLDQELFDIYLYDNEIINSLTNVFGDIKISLNHLYDDIVLSNLINIYLNNIKYNPELNNTNDILLILNYIKHNKASVNNICNYIENVITKKITSNSNNFNYCFERDNKYDILLYCTLSMMI
jgi:hypothetical protein